MKLILVVIDGLTPAVFEDAVESGATPASTEATGAASRRFPR